MLDEPVPSPSAALAAAVFLTAVRGLPLCDIEILSYNRLYKVLYDEKNKKHSVLIPKCKLLLSKMRILVNEIPIFTSLVKCNGETFCVTECSDCEHFTADSLRRIYTETRALNTDGAIAFSDCGTHLLAKSFFPMNSKERCIDTALSVLALAGPRGTEETVTVRACEVGIFCSELYDGIAISSEYTEPLTFTAPDIL